MKIAEYIAKHPPHEPRRRPANDDELRQLDTGDGVIYMKKPPADASERRVPTKKGDSGCHLWVIREKELPYILEHGEVCQTLASGRVTHTNLTGGGQASAGGELWIDPADPEKLYVNGCSGRYGPTTRAALEDAVEVLSQMGFDVSSFGWDDEQARPAMVLRDGRTDR